jgi:peptidoglycan/xylan/chitin deacetylase (PgdA/CDA1 family)
MRLAAISVDLDSLPHYCRIQGLDEALLDARARGLVYTTALERFGTLLARLGLPATYFAIGEDLEDAAAQGALRDAHRAGIEVGNHSYSHDYALAQREAVEIAADVERGEALIAAATGERPKGFRAPGYTLSPRLYRALCDRGYLYDSSTFPAAPYYAAKALVRAGLSLLGQPSRSILDTPRVLLAPRLPYRPNPAAPYRRGDGGVLELPIATAPVTRVPFIGTLATVLPWRALRAVYRSVRGMELLNFELHAIDVLDVDDGAPAALARRQRDLQIPHARKLERLASVFQWLKDDYEVVTLAQVARRLA